MFHLRYIYLQYQQVFYTPGPWSRKTCPLSTLVFPFQKRRISVFRGFTCNKSTTISRSCCGRPPRWCHVSCFNSNVVRTFEKTINIRLPLVSARQAPNIRKPLVYARQAPSHVPNIILWVSLPQASWLRISFDF